MEIYNKISLDDMCAVVVTFNGEKIIAESLLALIDNVNHILVVDNASTDKTLDIINDLNLNGVKVIKNDKNLGLSFALNRGAQFARDHGFKWILTMDQDSILNEGAVKELVDVYALLDSGYKDKLACLCINPSIDRNIVERYTKKKCVITSGNLVNIECLIEVGGYENKLFIDSVDFDFCLKVASKKYKIIQCNYATMEHQIGENRFINILGWRIRLNIHSRVRKFFISRNHIYILKSYFLKETFFCIKKTIFYLGFLLQVLFFEPNRLSNFRVIFKGLYCGIKGDFSDYESN